MSTSFGPKGSVTMAVEYIQKKSADLLLNVN